MKFLGKGTTGKIIEETDEKMDRLLKTFKDNLQNKYNRYAYIFFTCEVLNVTVVVSQIFITDAFLQNQFPFYGPKVWEYYAYPPEEIVQLDLVNPMCEAFPRVASCTFWKYGTGGKPVGHNAICILALNMVIDKIYLVLWYWYLIVAILGTIRIICRLFQMASGNIRYWLMKIKMHRYFSKTKNRELIKEYIKSITIGDWFVLYQMSKNLNRRFFYDFLIQLANDACGNGENENNPLVTVEDGSTKNLGNHITGSTCSNCSCNDLKKSTNNLAPPEDNGPPPLMQGSPAATLKIHTA